jgi:two-component system sensor histidine kinase RpfC
MRPLSPTALYRRLRARLSDRADTEHEQALIRIAIVALLLAYALVGPLPSPPSPWWVPTVPEVGYIVGTLSLLHFAWIVADPAVRPLRRALWSGIDHGAIILAMAVGGEPMALLYPLLLWVTLGHGFRYGPRYLIGSAIVSAVLFVPLVTLHPYWQVKGAFAVGLVLGLVLIPAYCLRLLQHLHVARRRAEASSEAKSRFLATMSHELRTPLNAILGMADLLRGSALEPEQREKVRTIQTSGQGLLNMIEDILDIARIEAGAERVDIEVFDVHRLLHEVRDMLAYRAGTKGLGLHLRFGADLVGELQGPRRAANQILVNLVANAVKFTDTGGVRIEADLARTNLGGAALHVAVVDTGCGIPAAARTRIFESFSQVDETTTRRHGGSGLGLAIVKRLVDGAGGTIALASVVDAGTRFDVTLPVQPADDPGPPEGTIVVVHGRATAHQRRTLDELGLRWRHADASDPGITAAEVVDLWCRDGEGAPPPPRHGRELIVWGPGPPVPEAVAVLADDAAAAALARAIRAAVVVAAPADDDTAPLRVQLGERSLDVLVADDHDVNRRVIERLLTQCGHRVEVVADGNAALAALARASFDAAVIDLNMPGRSGFDVARDVADRPVRPRLVALTADATAETRDACLAGGFDAYLTKPADGPRLLAALHPTGMEEANADEGTIAASTDPPAEAPPGAPDDDLLDLARIRMLHQLGDDAFVAEVVDSFIADGARLVDELADAAVAGDAARFRDAAHALRSAATHLGATALFERCLAVKSIDSDALSREAPAIRDDLARAFEATAAALRAAAHPVKPPPASTGCAPAAPSCEDPAARAPAPARPTGR